jgi:hypothetical protein
MNQKNEEPGKGNSVAFIIGIGLLMILLLIWAVV